MDLKAQMDPNTVIMGDLSTPLSPIDRTSRQKINNNKKIRITRHFGSNGDNRHLQSISFNHHSSQQLMEVSP
jgi:hypothetical protein